jgi:hypothetical protein
MQGNDSLISPQSENTSKKLLWILLGWTLASEFDIKISQLSVNFGTVYTKGCWIDLSPYHSMLAVAIYLISSRKQFGQLTTNKDPFDYFLFLD